MYSLAFSRLRADIRAMRSGLVTTSRILADKAATSPGGTISSGASSSGIPPTVEPIHGNARAIASIIALGKPS